MEVCEHALMKNHKYEEPYFAPASEEEVLLEQLKKMSVPAVDENEQLQWVLCQECVICMVREYCILQYTLAYPSSDYPTSFLSLDVGGDMQGRPYHHPLHSYTGNRKQLGKQ